jgi:hypothetical protein
MLRLAEEFMKGAEKLTMTKGSIQAGSDPLKVPLYLYGHAIELIAKAILVAAGTTEDQLRRLGHDLTAAFRAVRRQPGTIDLIITPQDFAVLGMLSPYYQAKDLEYVAVGFRRYPLPTVVGELARRLLAHAEPAIARAVRAWLRTRKPTEEV